MSYIGIDIYGTATFEFDLDMIVDPKFKQIRTKELLSIIGVRIIPGMDSDESKLNINALSIQTFEARKMVLKVDFAEPLYIS